MKLTIRETTSADKKTIYHVEKRAFGEVDEAELAENLLADPTAQPALSLLAFVEEEPVGHILFTKATLTNQAPLSIRILAPLAVVPEYQ